MVSISQEPFRLKRKFKGLVKFYSEASKVTCNCKFIQEPVAKNNDVQNSLCAAQNLLSKRVHDSKVNFRYIPSSKRCNRVPRVSTLRDSLETRLQKVKKKRRFIVYFEVPSRTHGNPLWKTTTTKNHAYYGTYLVLCIELPVVFFQKSL